MAKKTFKKKVKRNIKKNEKFIIVAITIFVLTGLLGVTYYMYSSQEKNPHQSTILVEIKFSLSKIRWG